MARCYGLLNVVYLSQHPVQKETMKDSKFIRWCVGSSGSSNRLFSTSSDGDGAGEERGNGDFIRDSTICDGGHEIDVNGDFEGENGA